jgi:hypothetical protein
MALAIAAPAAEAEFGVGSISAAALNRDGTPDFQAGSHPFEFRFSMAMNRDGLGRPEGSLRSLRVDLPLGFVGNPRAVPRCRRADFEGASPHCSGDSQIGVVEMQIPGIGDSFGPIYNLVPSPGVSASIGFSIVGFNGFQQALLRTGLDYGLSQSIAPVSNGEVLSVTETIWGVPADEAHDAQRVCFSGAERIEGCASNATPAPFLSLPTSCDGPLETTVVVESATGEVDRKSALSLDVGGEPRGLVGCEGVPFDPQAAVGFSSGVTDSPTGMSFEMNLPQPMGVGARSEAALRSAVVELPEGMTVNPSIASGLEACSPAQIGLQSPPGDSPPRFTAAPADCPSASRIGAVRLATPLVDHGLEGAVYLAAPEENPFGSLLAVYLAVDDEESGVVLKLPAELTLDSRGRPGLRLEEAPELPIEELEVSFPAGSRALLRTPQVCAVGTASANLLPSSAPQGAPETFSSPYRTTVPASGSSCPVDLAELPAGASLAAGTVSPSAGQSSTFLLKVARADGTQPLGAIEADLPLGLSARLAGIPTCSEAEIAGAACPPSSEVGSVGVTAGAGPLPVPLEGRAYLAGPYRGAPFSIATVTPARVGPFDLGTVAVRIALYLDPSTARIRAVSDPLPATLRDVPLNLRSLTVRLSRAGFVRNPTSCAPQGIAAAMTTAAGRQVLPRQRFQAGDCARLGFKPTIGLRLLGSAKRGAHPALRAVVKTRSGDANIRRATVSLPAGQLLDSRRIRAVCGRLDFAAADCPAAAAIGRVEVWTPLLDDRLTGSVFLLAGKRRLPDLGAVVEGRFGVDLRARLESRKGRLRVTFPALPDIPLSRLRLTVMGGSRGVLVNSGGICRGGRRVQAGFSAQSGRFRSEQRRLQVHCGHRRTGSAVAP